jgi:hypothetical protein
MHCKLILAVDDGNISVTCTRFSHREKGVEAGIEVAEQGLPDLAVQRALSLVRTRDVRLSSPDD